MAGKEFKIIYYVSPKNEQGKSFWNRIGVAFVNRDGSLNCKFESFPVNGECQIRDYVPREGDGGQGAPPPARKSYTKPKTPDTSDPDPGEDDVPF